MYNFNTKVSYTNEDSDDVYREQLCEAFNTTEYDQDMYFKVMKEIIEQFGENRVFKQIIQFSKEKYQEDEDIYALMYLFSWDHFENLHTCLFDLFTTGSIQEESMTWLSV